MNLVPDIPRRCRSPGPEKKVVMQTGVNVKEMLGFWEKQAQNNPYKLPIFKSKVSPRPIKIVGAQSKALVEPNEGRKNGPREIHSKISSPVSPQPTEHEKASDEKIPSSLPRLQSKTGLVSNKSTQEVATSGSSRSLKDEPEGEAPPQNTINIQHFRGPRKQLSRRGISLDELLESNHKPLSYHRRASQRRLELQKALSYGRMQELSNTFHSKDANILKESLHRAQQKVKEATQIESPDPWSVPELAKELSDIFFNALFLDNDGGDQEGDGSPPKLTVEQMRDLVLELSVDEMVEIIKHFELCENTNSAVRWDLIQSIVYPDLDDEGEDADDSASFIMSDDDEAYEILDYFESAGHDDDSEATGITIEANNASCNSSITGFWSLYSEDGSFAEEEIEEVLVEDEDDDDEVEILYEYEEN